jgi:hypothetical protein
MVSYRDNFTFFFIIIIVIDQLCRGKHYFGTAENFVCILFLQIIGRILDCNMIVGIGIVCHNVTVRDKWLA